MKLVIALLITVFATLTVAGQPTLEIRTEIPGLPSELFYGNVKVKPVRLRPGTNTPITINDADFFVQQQYIDFLSRFPDQSGFNFWLTQITNCNGVANCIAGQRDNTSGAFFLSIEFTETGTLAVLTFKAAFGDATGDSTWQSVHQLPVPKIRRSEFLPDQLQLSNGVIVGQTGWEAVLENNKLAYFNGFVQRPAFVSLYPQGMAAADYVDALFGKTGITPTAGERQSAINAYGSGNTAGRAAALRQVAQNATFAAAEKNKVFVLMQYFGYLRRDPNVGRDSDYTGYDFWLQKLNNHNSDFHAAEMVRSFLLSGEYIDRF